MRLHELRSLCKNILKLAVRGIFPQEQLKPRVENAFPAAEHREKAQESFPLMRMDFQIELRETAAVGRLQ